MPAINSKPLSENLPFYGVDLYQHAKDHLRLFLATRGRDTFHCVVFHIDVMPELPKGTYAVVKVEIVDFDEVEKNTPVCPPEAPGTT